MTMKAWPWKHCEMKGLPLSLAFDSVVVFQRQHQQQRSWDKEQRWQPLIKKSLYFWTQKRKQKQIQNTRNRNTKKMWSWRDVKEEIEKSGDENKEINKNKNN